jgi:hypothetical protein
VLFGSLGPWLPHSLAVAVLNMQYMSTGCSALALNTSLLMLPVLRQVGSCPVHCMLSYVPSQSQASSLAAASGVKTPIVVLY